MDKPRQGFWGLWNIGFGFFGIQIGFALQNANMSRIFQTLGAELESLPVLWIAAPLTGLLVQPIIGHMSDRTWLGRRPSSTSSPASPPISRVRSASPGPFDRGGNWLLRH